MPQGRQAILADGTELNFPSDTPDEVIQAVVKKHLGVAAPTSPVTPVSSKVTAPVNDRVAQRMRNDNDQSKTPNDALAELGDITKTGASIAGGAAAGLTSGPLAGSATYEMINELLNHFTTNSPTSFSETAARTGLDEIGGRVIGAGIKGVKGIGAALQELAPGELGTAGNILSSIRDKALSLAGKKTIPNFVGPVAADTVKTGAGSVLGNTDLLKLNPTASELTGNKILKFVEDVGAPGTKNAALQDSADLAKGEVNKLVNKISGKNVTDPSALPNAIKDELASNEQRLQAISNGQAEKVNNIATKNTVTQDGFDPEEFKKVVADVAKDQAQGKVQDATTGDVDSNAKRLIELMAFKNENKLKQNIAGPVNLNETVAKAGALLNDMNRSLIKPDPENPVFKALNDIINATGAKNENGVWTPTKQISFGDAWKTKQVADSLGYSGEGGIRDVRFKGIAHSLNNDIENSIPNWPENSSEALNNFQNAKANVATRLSTFHPEDSNGKNIESLLQSNDSSIPQIDSILQDPTKIQKIILAGNLKVPTDAGDVTLKSNSRKYLQAYALQKIANDSLISSVNDPSQQAFDAKKLFQSLNDPKTQESFKALFGSSGNSNFTQFFKNIAEVSQKQVEPSRYLATRVGLGGLTVGAGVMESALKGGTLPLDTLGAAGIGTTAIIGFHGLAKLLTDKTTGRLMVSLAQGGPLGLSTQMASRLITRQLIGEPIRIQKQDGTEIQGKIGLDGKFVKEN